jgi:hypothetical protein
MWEELELPRALQNHFLQARHFTTLAGEWMPQYLARSVSQFLHQAERTYSRASVGGKLLLFLWCVQFEAFHAIDRDTCQALVVVVEDLGLVVVVILAAPGVAQAGAGTASSINAVEQALVWVDVGKLVGTTSLNGGRGIGNEVVPQVGKSALHIGGNRGGTVAAINEEGLSVTKS